jgi:hypothetical protein
MSVFYSTDPSELRRQLGEQLTDKVIGQYIEAECMDDMAVEIAEAEGESFAGFCEDNAPKTYQAARDALIERQAQAIEDQRRYGNEG